MNYLTIMLKKNQDLFNASSAVKSLRKIIFLSSYEVYGSAGLPQAETALVMRFKPKRIHVTHMSISLSRKLYRDLFR